METAKGLIMELIRCHEKLALNDTRLLWNINERFGAEESGRAITELIRQRFLRVQCDVDSDTGEPVLYLIREP